MGEESPRWSTDSGVCQGGGADGGLRRQRGAVPSLVAKEAARRRVTTKRGAALVAKELAPTSGLRRFVQELDGDMSLCRIHRSVQEVNSLTAPR